MASHPTFSSKNSIKFPSDQNSRLGASPFGTHNGGADAPADGPGEDPGADPRPKSLVAAIDEVSPANDDEHVAAFAHNVGRSPASPEERGGERLGAADIDNLENRIAARIGEIGSGASAARAPQVPQLDTAGKDPKVVYDPELIEILEQLNQTLDTAHAVLSDGSSPGQQPSLPPPLPRPEMQSRRPQRPMVLSAIALSLLVGTGGLIYAYPWIMERSPAEPEIADTAPAPAVAASRIREDSEPAAASEAQPGAARDGAASGTTLAAATPNGGDTGSAAITDSGPAQVQLPQVQFTVEPASGAAGEPIDLKLTLPSNADGPDTSIMMQGLPAGSRLSAGQQIREDTWIVPPSQADGLQLLLPTNASPGLLVLDVTLVTSNGTLPEARKLAVAVAPAKRAEPAPLPAPAPQARQFSAAPAQPPRETAAPPAPTPRSRQAAVNPAPAPVETAPPRQEQAQRAPAPVQRTISEAAESRLLSRGQGLMRDGDIAGARLIFEHAAQRGSVKAMVALAKSYDPDLLGQLGVQGIQPDLEKAINWYERASRSGDQESSVRVKALMAQARR
ncbi:MAG: hypothetical protein MI824_22150 [Hyphomicrobiales bacterium]|nr:hypothetical protein [Hyphomicrobiales bacterium]